MLTSRTWYTHKMLLQQDVSGQLSMRAQKSRKCDAIYNVVGMYALGAWSTDAWLTWRRKQGNSESAAKQRVFETAGQEQALAAVLGHENKTKCGHTFLPRTPPPASYQAQLFNTVSLHVCRLPSLQIVQNLIVLRHCSFGNTHLRIFVCCV